jgi:hypothetical protein
VGKRLFFIDILKPTEEKKIQSGLVIKFIKFKKASAYPDPYHNVTDSVSNPDSLSPDPEF